MYLLDNAPFIFLGYEIEDAVTDDTVDRVRFYRYTVDIAVYKLDIRSTHDFSVALGEGDHFLCDQNQLADQLG